MAMYGYALKDKQNEKKIAELLVALPSKEIFFLVHSDAASGPKTRFFDTQKAAEEALEKFKLRRGRR